jgi:hypothetical protein
MLLSLKFKQKKVITLKDVTAKSLAALKSTVNATKVEFPVLNYVFVKVVKIVKKI